MSIVLFIFLQASTLTGWAKQVVKEETKKQFKLQAKPEEDENNDREEEESEHDDEDGEVTFH